VKLSARYLLTAGVIGLTLAVVSAARPSWAADLGLDFWSVPALQERIARDQQIASKLAARDEQTLRRIAVKETIIEDLLAKRITLLEAAAEFRALNAGKHAYTMVLRSVYPDMSDEERVCRNVIGYVESYADGDEDGRATIHRLQEDLQRLKASGSIHLPGPAIDLDAVTDEDDDVQ
jgi:hypothetical protein